MQKKWILKLCFILCFIILLPFSFCFASENEKENEEATKKELLLVIDECINDIKNEIKSIDKILDELDKTEEYEAYPAVRLNIDTPFFGLNSMVNNKLKIKNEVSTVDVARGYSIKDIVNNKSIKLPDFTVGNIVVSTRDVKFDENISVEDAKEAILKLVQYISQTKNTKELVNKRINYIFEGYIPKEKLEKITNLENRLDEINSKLVSTDNDILCIKLLNNDENSKALVEKYYTINNKIYNEKKLLDNMLLSYENLQDIEKEIATIEIDNINYTKDVSKEKGNLTKDINIDLLLNNTKNILTEKQKNLEEYEKNSNIEVEVKESLNEEENKDEVKTETRHYDVTSKHIIEYEKNLIKTLDEKIQYYLPEEKNESEENNENVNEEKDKREISADEKKSILDEVLKLYNDYLARENKFYLDNLNYILRDTTYKLSKLPDYTDSNTVKEIKYIYISLPTELDNMLDEYGTKYTFKTDRLTTNLLDRLLKISKCNVQVNVEYDKYNLS